PRFARAELGTRARRESRAHDSRFTAKSTAIDDRRRWTQGNKRTDHATAACSRGPRGQVNRAASKAFVASGLSAKPRCDSPHEVNREIPSVEHKRIHGSWLGCRERDSLTTTEQCRRAALACRSPREVGRL